MRLELIEYTLLDKERHKTLLQLRNSEYVRKQMSDPKVIALNDHLGWVKGLQGAKRRRHFAVFFQGELIGGVALTDITKESASWGVFFARGANPLALSAAVYLFLRYGFETAGIKRLYAQVKKTNANALSFNKSFGFVPRGELEINATAHEELVLEKAQFETAPNRNVKALEKRKKRFEIYINGKRYE